MRISELFPRNSIRRKLLVGVSLIGIPPLAVLFYQNYYALSVLREKSGESYRRAVVQYLNRIDDNLGDVDRHLRVLTDTDADVLTMAETRDENAYRISKVRLGRRFIESVLQYSHLDALFAYSPSRDDFLEIFSTGGSYAERMRMRDVIRGGMKVASLGIARERDWRTIVVGGEWYLVRAIRTGDIVVGAWCRVRRLVEEASLFPPADLAVSAFADEYGAAMTDTGPSRLTHLVSDNEYQRFYAYSNGKAYLVVGAESHVAPMRFHAVIPDQTVVRNLPYLQWVILAVSVAMFVFFPIGALLTLRKTVVYPLERMLRAITSIREGAASGRIIPGPSSDEFRRVTEAFNAMMTEIDELRISVYEEQLAIHREELLRLRAQVNPHFFLNSINMIYSLVVEKDYDRVSQSMLLLSNFFRYSVRNSSDFVSLSEELSHVEDYFRIQRLRFRDEPELVIDAAEFLLEQPIPPLMLQVFVENSFRHGARVGSRMDIRIRAEHEVLDGSEFLAVSISDNGRGFPLDYLECYALNCLESRSSPSGDHIGIKNAERRLSLLYKGRARLVLSNEIDGSGLTKGARVELLLPIADSGGLPGEGAA